MRKLCALRCPNVGVLLLQKQQSSSGTECQNCDQNRIVPLQPDGGFSPGRGGAPNSSPWRSARNSLLIADKQKHSSATPPLFFPLKVHFFQQKHTAAVPPSTCEGTGSSPEERCRPDTFMLTLSPTELPGRCEPLHAAANTTNFNTSEEKMSNRTQKLKTCWMWMCWSGWGRPSPFTVWISQWSTKQTWDKTSETKPF